MNEAAAEDAAGPELIFGLVGAVGTDLSLVSEVLEEALAEMAYDVEVVRLSALLTEVDWKRELPETPLDEHIDKHMDAGDALREEWQRGDALALLAISAVNEARERLTGAPDRPAARTVYVLRSLKHPDEVERLRSVYGKRFVLLSAYSPTVTRTRALQEGIAASRNSLNVGEYASRAHHLINRDEAEQHLRFGQNVQDTFHLADVFVDARDRRSLTKDLGRLVEILFGHRFRTPNPHEQAMFLAEAAAMRSAEMGRQVGAVVATERGDIVSVGTNEVPRPGGGLYWEGDEDDARDFQQGADTSDKYKRVVAAELLDRLRTREWLAEDKQSAEIDEMYDAIRGTRVASLIEFGRAVHAEMAALIDAARRGVAVDRCSVYVTTFPCHGCARHLIAAGIKNVFYVAPYPKSLAEALHGDALVVDDEGDESKRVRFQPFVGVAPRAYLDFFSMLDRKDRKGEIVTPSKRRSVPRVLLTEPETTVPPYLKNEDLALESLLKTIESKPLKLKQAQEMDEDEA